MALSEMNPKVDFYFVKDQKWKDEIAELRMIALSSGLTEELKWGCPCYTLDKTNVVLIHVFKEYCAFLFFQGALMNDPDGILIQQTENVQAARQIRFVNLREVVEAAGILEAYIQNAIDIAKSGQRLALKKTTEFKITEEFQDKLNDMPELKTAFEALTPGRQRAYMLHFSQPKQVKIRESRIEKCIPQILTGKGLND